MDSKLTQSLEPGILDFWGFTKFYQIKTRNVLQSVPSLAEKTLTAASSKGDRVGQRGSSTPAQNHPSLVHQQSMSRESYWFYFVLYPETKNL